MKIQFLLRLLYTVVFLLVIIPTFVSCSEDENPLDNTLFTIYIAPGSLNSHLDTWFFLTDNEGKLLGIQEAIDGLNIIFERPSGFKDKQFSVHKVVYELAADDSYADFVFTTYAGVSGGQIHLPIISPNPVYETVGDFSFSVTGVPTGYSPKAVGPRISVLSGNGMAGNYTGKIGLLDASTSLMLWWGGMEDRTKVPRYSFISQVVPGTTFAATFANLTVADEITYNFGTSIDKAEFRVEPYIPGAGYSGTLEYFTQKNVTSSKLYHPGNVYASYNTWIRLTDGEHGQTTHIFGAIPTTIKTLSATIDSFISEDDKLSVETTGTYDYLYVYGFTEWLTGAQEHWLTWYIYMDDEAKKNYTVPAFPQVLLERYPELQAANKNFYSVFINDSNNINGYKEYLQSAWRTASFPQFTESLSRSRKFLTGARMTSEQVSRGVK